MAKREELNGWRTATAQEDAYIKKMLLPRIKGEIKNEKIVTIGMFCLGLGLAAGMFQLLKAGITAVKADITMENILLLSFCIALEMGGLVLFGMSLRRMREKPAKRWYQQVMKENYKVLDVRVVEESSTNYIGRYGAVYDRDGEPYEYEVKGKRYIRTIAMYATMNGAGILVYVLGEKETDSTYEILLPCCKN